MIQKLSKFLIVCCLAIGLSSTSYADLTNAGFEDDDASGGDVANAAGWGNFNGGSFTSSTAATPFEGNNVMKIFGPFGATPDAAGMFQALAASEGQTWLASAQAQNWAGDPLQGQTFGAVQLQFLDGADALIGSTLESAQVTASATQDVWNLLTVSGIAPTGTAKAQIVLIHAQPVDPVVGGSIFFDAASLSVVPEPGSAILLSLCAVGMVCRRRR